MVSQWQVIPAVAMICTGLSVIVRHMVILIGFVMTLRVADGHEKVDAFKSFMKAFVAGGGRTPQDHRRLPPDEDQGGLDAGG